MGEWKQTVQIQRTGGEREITRLKLKICAWGAASIIVLSVSMIPVVSGQIIPFRIKIPFWVQPLSFATITAVSLDSQMRYSVTANEDGAYALGGLPTGMYDFSATSPYMSGPPLTKRGVEIYPGVNPVDISVDITPWVKRFPFGNLRQLNSMLSTGRSLLDADAAEGAG